MCSFRINYFSLFRSQKVYNFENQYFRKMTVLHGCGQLNSVFTLRLKINLRAFLCESKTVFIEAVQTNGTSKIIEDNHSESEYLKWRKTFTLINPELVSRPCSQTKKVNYSDILSRRKLHHLLSSAEKGFPHDTFLSLISYLS